jgi:bifunctional ADP-heptose synthase (sugar kinase/adenylyltransferase)
MFDEKVNVLVIGDVMVDEYLFGIVTRISPEAPVPVVQIKERVYKLGGAGNVLNNLLQFTNNIKFVSVTGNSDNKFLHESLKPADAILLEDVQRVTTLKTRILSNN